MDELCRENEFNYFMINEDYQETNPIASFFILLSIIPMSVLFAMVVISQHMQITGNLDVDDDEEEEEKEELFEEKYPLKKKNNTNKEPNTELLSIIECTPNGNVFMKYNLDNEGFDYWSDYKEIPFNYLETVARKYVNMFNCSDLYLREEDEEVNLSDEEYSSEFEDDSEEIEEETEEDDSEEETEEDDSEEEEEMKKELNTCQQEDSDDDIFAKFKTTEKIKETIKEEGNIVNKFRYKGKLVDILVFKQKINKKQEPKNISFSSWSVF